MIEILGTDARKRRLFGLPPQSTHTKTTAVAMLKVNRVQDRLAALVPKFRINLNRFDGVLAPNGKHRALMTPAGRVKERKPNTADESTDQTPAGAALQRADGGHGV